MRFIQQKPQKTTRSCIFLADSWFLSGQFVVFGNFNYSFLIPTQLILTPDKHS